MTTWAEFDTAAPELAALATERFASTQLILLGTIRRNGWPRISPCEYLVVDGDLYLGMIWRSKKALDLLREPRCVLHSTTTSKDGDEGDVKVYGRAVDERRPERRAGARRAAIEAMDFDPESGGDYHLFRIDITEVGYTNFADGKLNARTWRPGPEPAAA
ncbi:MAG: pyridoxamine 5'-phosphate oxidase family protein [Acidimicrobiales bacterium]